MTISARRQRSVPEPGADCAELATCSPSENRLAATIKQGGHSFSLAYFENNFRETNRNGSRRYPRSRLTTLYKARKKTISDWACCPTRQIDESKYRKRT